MTSTPTIEPQELTAGDTVKWKKALSDYKASDGWELTYALRGPQDIDLTATADSADHLVTIAAASSAGYAAGTYWWQSYVSKDGERYRIASGTLEVKEDLSQVTGIYSKLSHAKEVLAALEATILKKASRDQQSYSIAGRSLSRMTPEELIKWRDVYRREVRNEEKAEKIARGESIKNIIHVRFGGVS